MRMLVVVMLVLCFVAFCKVSFGSIPKTVVPTVSCDSTDVDPDSDESDEIIVVWA